MKKTIIITGASSGIGKACAEKLAVNHNIILCSRSEDKLLILEQTLLTKGYGNKITHAKLDVTNNENVKDLFQKLQSTNIFADVLINAAGLALGLETLDESDDGDIRTMVDTNITGLLFMSKYALKLMKKNNRGHIINIGSIAGINPYPTGITYAATKAAVKSISDGLRKDVISYNIRITNIQPGLVKTNFSLVRFKGDIAKSESVYNGIKPLTADDIAEIIKYSIESPDYMQLNEITVTPTHQATVEYIFRKINK